MRVAFSVSCLVGHIHIHYFNILHDFVMPDFVVALECLCKGRMCSYSGKALEAPSCPGKPKWAPGGCRTSDCFEEML